MSNFFNNSKFILYTGIPALLLMTTACSSNDDDAAFLNTRVENGMVIMGSDPTIDDYKKQQTELTIESNKNILRTSGRQRSNDIGNPYRTSSTSGRQSKIDGNLKNKIVELNNILLGKITFDKNQKVKKTTITRDRLSALVDAYSMNLEKNADSKQLTKLKKMVDAALKNEPNVVTARENLADFYLNGVNGHNNEELAASWYIIASGADSTYAQYMMSILYQLGIGVPKDLNESVAWYKRASEKKDSAVAKLRVAKMYLSPQSVIYDEKQAALWMESSATQGNIEAQYLLADMYLQGKGVDESPMDAIKWYGKSATQGSAYAQYSLGVIYYNGDGIEQNLLEAHKWLNYAALQGNNEAQYLLARMYEQGFGVEKNIPRAYAWYTFIPQDNIIISDLQSKMDNLTASMTPAQRVNAQEIIKDIKKKIG